MTSRQITPGAYDSVVSEALAELLNSLPRELRAFEKPLDPEAAPDALARIVHDRLRRTLMDIPDRDDEPRLQAQIAATNSLLLNMEELSRRGVTIRGDHVRQPGRRLLAVLPVTQALTEVTPPLLPEVPLSTSELLVNSRHDLRLGTEVIRELATADSVDLLCSFLKWSGFRVLEEGLRALGISTPEEANY